MGTGYFISGSINWDTEIAEEYALPVNVNTLTGENLHR
jgi:hypothetical protein